MTESVFEIVQSQLIKILGDRYIKDRVFIWDKFLSLYGENWDAGTLGQSLNQCLARVYTKSGAKTLQEFRDYIEIQVTFL